MRSPKLFSRAMSSPLLAISMLFYVGAFTKALASDLPNACQNVTANQSKIIAFLVAKEKHQSDKLLVSFIPQYQLSTLRRAPEASEKLDIFASLIDGQIHKISDDVVVIGPKYSLSKSQQDLKSDVDYLEKSKSGSEVLAAFSCISPEQRANSFNEHLFKLTTLASPAFQNIKAIPLNPNISLVKYLFGSERQDSAFSFRFIPDLSIDILYNHTPILYCDMWARQKDGTITWIKDASLEQAKQKKTSHVVTGILPIEVTALPQAIKITDNLMTLGQLANLMSTVVKPWKVTVDKGIANRQVAMTKGTYKVTDLFEALHWTASVNITALQSGADMLLHINDVDPDQGLLVLYKHADDRESERWQVWADFLKGIREVNHAASPFTMKDFIPLKTLTLEELTLPQQMYIRSALNANGIKLNQEDTKHIRISPRLGIEVDSSINGRFNHGTGSRGFLYTDVGLR